MFRPKIALAILALSASACGGGGESNSNSTDSGAPDTADSVAGDAGPDVVMPSDAGPLTDSTSPMDSEASADMPIVDAPTMDAEDAGMDVTMPPDAGTLVDTASQLDAEVSTDTPVTDTALVDAPVQDVPPADAGPPACPSGQQRCGEQCVDLTASVNDCGACGTRCQGADNAVAVCVAGRCALTCTAGFADCDGMASNGCEVNTTTAASHCGACGRTCALPNTTTATCAASTCRVGTCAAGFGDCDGNPANGCETSLNTTPTACGMCGRTCSLSNATAACAGGQCTVASCATGYGNCDNNAANGCETLLNSNTNCGACGQSCSMGTRCAMGACVSTCPMGTTFCSGSSICADLQSDVANCGSCDTSCPSFSNSRSTCAAGSCGYGCVPGFGDCDGNRNNGCEANLGSSDTHCGSCGRSCQFSNAAGQCVSGQCRLAICNSGFGDCDGNPSNGCEVDLNTTPTACGMCGRTCSLSNATAGCAGGQCTVSSCAAGFGNCDNNAANGCETPINTNTHCGACGRSCEAGANCMGGTCVQTYQGIVAAARPVAWWSLDEASGSSVRDGVGGRTAQLGSGAVVTMGEPGLIATGRSIRFSSGSGFRLPFDSSLVSRRFSVEFLMRARPCPSGQFCAALAFRDLGGGVGGWTFYRSGASSDLPFYALTAHSGSWTVIPAVDPVDDRIRHVVLVADAAELRLYLDGTLNTRMTRDESTRNLPTSPNVFAIGGANGNGTSGFIGNLDEVALYDRVLSPSEVAAHSAAVTSCAPGLADCDGNVSNGCETDVSTAVSSCGACGRMCNLPNSTPTCVSGQCGVAACSAGFGNCDSNASNGCETTLNTDRLNCGSCGRVCAAGQSCAAGACAVRCGDGLLGTGETCDDGNTVDGDGCSAQCQRECSSLTMPTRGGYAEVPDATPLRLASGSFTLEAWVYAVDYDNACNSVILAKRGLPVVDGWFLSVTGPGCGPSAGRLFYQQSGGGAPSIVGNVTAPVGRWFHVAVTRDDASGLVTLWQDGVSVGSNTMVAPSATTSAALRIGQDTGGSNYPWRGHFDTVRISNTVRYTTGFTPPTRLAPDSSTRALWDFNETSGPILDRSGNGHNATMVMGASRASGLCAP
jgi:hypothetical protein